MKSSLLFILLDVFLIMNFIVLGPLYLALTKLTCENKLVWRLLHTSGATPMLSSIGHYFVTNFTNKRASFKHPIVWVLSCIKFKFYLLFIKLFLLLGFCMINLLILLLYHVFGFHLLKMFFYFVVNSFFLLSLFIRRG